MRGPPNQKLKKDRAGQQKNKKVPMGKKTHVRRNRANIGRQRKARPAGGQKPNLFRGGTPNVDGLAGEERWGG